MYRWCKKKTNYRCKRQPETAILTVIVSPLFPSVSFVSKPLFVYVLFFPCSICDCQGVALPRCVAATLLHTWDSFTYQAPAANIPQLINRSLPEYSVHPAAQNCGQEINSKRTLDFCNQSFSNSPSFSFLSQDHVSTLDSSLFKLYLPCSTETSDSGADFKINCVPVYCSPACFLCPGITKPDTYKF